MRPYIQKNIALRQTSKTKFEKDFWKLCNNAVFGKQMENVRNRIEFFIMSDEKKLLKYVAKPHYKSRVIFDDNLVGVHMFKRNVILDKPIFIGQAILGLSKHLMYEFITILSKKNFQQQN
jgi:hypothetical protein